MPRKNNNNKKNEEGMDGDSNPIDIQSYLKGVDYPATKQDLLDFANDQDAPEGVIETLDGLPEKDYMKPVDVSKELADAM